MEMHLRRPVRRPIPGPGLSSPRPRKAPCRLSDHAAATMAARGITLDDVLTTIREPDVTEPHLGRTRYARGPITIVTTPDYDGTPYIITVLLRASYQWENTDARERRRA